MATHTLKKLPKNTVEIEVSIARADIKKEYDQAFASLLKDFEAEGFRKGKVPAAVAQKKISKDLVYQKLIQNLLPKIYDQIVKQEGLKPVISPKVELIKAKEDEDWQIRISLAERPAVVLGEYKKVVKEVKTKQKKGEIWVPGKDKSQEQTDTSEAKQRLLNDILAALLKQVKIEISDLIVEEELNLRLSRLLDDVNKIGLTVEAYLKSKGTTMEQLKAQYTKEIEDIHKVELLLNEVADQEGIAVEQKELEELFSKITDLKQQQEARQNSYFYAALLRKQKTLDFLETL